MERENNFKNLVPYDLSSPEFLKRLQCLDAVEDQETAISCQVIADPIPKIQWFCEDGTEIQPSNPRYEISYCLKTGNATLRIKNTLLSDEMSYKCVASNTHGTAKTIGILVVRANKDKKKLVPPANDRRSASPLKNIDVPPSNLLPVKEETEISSSQSEESIVDILKISENEEKKCRILDRPPELLKIKEGDDLKICFNIVGDPSPTIFWFKDNEPLKDDYRIDIYNEKSLHYLEIFDCLARYAGNYEITAKNLHNQISAQVKIEIGENPCILVRPVIEGLYQYDSRKETYRPPQFIIKPMSQTIHEGRKLTLLTQVSGIPNPEICWFRDGKPLSHEPEDKRIKIYEKEKCSYFEISNISILDTGEYTCTASNVMGAVYSAINILVEAMTEPETGASSEVYSDQEKSADSELGVHCSYSDNTDTSTSAKSGSRAEPCFRDSGIRKKNTHLCFYQSLVEERKSRRTKCEQIDTDKHINYIDNRFENIKKSEPDLENFKIILDLDFEKKKIKKSRLGFFLGLSNNSARNKFTILIRNEYKKKIFFFNLENNSMKKLIEFDAKEIACYLSERRYKEIAEKLVEKHVKDHITRCLSARHSESEKDILLKEFILLEDYTDEQREITIFKNDIVEILDNDKPEKWLVRTKYKTLNQVCYIPPNLLEEFESSKVKKIDLDYQNQFVRVSKRQSKVSTFTISNMAQPNPNTDDTKESSGKKYILNENYELENVSCKRSKLNDLTLSETNMKSDNVYNVNGLFVKNEIRILMLKFSDVKSYINHVNSCVLLFNLSFNISEHVLPGSQGSKWISGNNTYFIKKRTSGRDELSKQCECAY
ncbi:muscle M-line assembly unc-89-like [Brachionus plicatilis]|uniref:Muscle M-line assembly unc-89-like n=1 Tax=Brachionus plicatilis TaxID=10195 RepID=A0A3M7SFY3_BRAPC|nr:muscle M-line assembly unc-89-like [Brachionus plicatilis]